MEDDEVNLYDDLLINEEEERNEAQNRKIEEFVELEKDNASQKVRIQELETELGSVTKQNDILRRNISVLFKTAKAEISRKDLLIRELQRKYDEIIFRRTKIGSEFLGRRSHHTDPELNNGASTSRFNGNNGKKSETVVNDEGSRPMKRQKVDENFNKSKSSARFVEIERDKSLNAKKPEKAEVLSKSSDMNTSELKIGSKSGLSDKERTFAHFTARMSERERVRVTKRIDDVNEKQISGHSNNFIDKDRNEDRGQRRENKCPIPDKKPSKTSVCESDKSNAKVDSRHGTKTDQKSIKSSSEAKNGDPSSSDRWSRDRGQRNVSRIENKRKRNSRSRSRSPSRRDRERVRDSANVSRIHRIGRDRR